MRPLTGNGNACDCAGTAAEANGLIVSSQYNLAFLDLGLPDVDSVNLLRHWRCQQIILPMLTITARDALEDLAKQLLMLSPAGQGFAS